MYTFLCTSSCYNGSMSNIIVIERPPEDDKSRKKKSHWTGNQYARKFNTSEERQQLMRDYIKHCEGGFSDDAFTPCDKETFWKYVKDFPHDFDTNEIKAAQRERQRRWEGHGIAGMLGQIRGFRERVWEINMRNRFGWKDEKSKEDEEPQQVSEGERLEQIFAEVLIENKKNEGDLGADNPGA